MNVHSTGLLKGDQQARYRVLDSFRGIAAVLVAIGHYAAHSGHSALFPQSYILSVDFFFALTGFVVYSSLRKSTCDAHWLRSFVIRRVFRIFPGYLAASALFIIVSGLFIRGDLVLLRNAQSNLTTFFLLHMGGFTSADYTNLGPSPMSLAWALSVEVWVCIVFFAGVAALRRRLLALVIVLTMTAWGSLAIIATYSPAFMDVHFQKVGPLPIGVMRGLVGFSVGTLACIASQSMRRMKHPTFWEIGVLVALFLTYGKIEYWRSDDYVMPLYSFAILLIYSHEAGWMSKVLLTKPFLIIGSYSFGIYMTHPMVIDVLNSAGVSLSKVAVVLMLALSILLAAVLFVFVEQPGMRLGSAMAAKAEERSQNAAA